MSSTDYDAVLTQGDTYALPSDCIRPIMLNPGRSHEQSINWDVIDRHVVTNETAPITLLYIARVTDEGQWTPLFRKTVAAYLAHELAYPLTESNTKMAAMESLYEKRLDKAAAQSAFVGRKRQFTVDSRMSLRRRR